MQQRLQKLLAAAGIASRRRAEEIIAAGRVAVDGEVVRQLGTVVDPDVQKVTFDGEAVKVAHRRHYIALHKPAGYVSTVSDPHAEKKVTDLVQIPGARLVPVGRLDADSEGLLLLSDDGDFVFKVTHPSQSLGKTYVVTVVGKPDEETLKRLSRGLRLEGESRKTAPANATWAGKGREKGTHIIEMVLHEGRNRQIRRMLEMVGHPVVRLVRTRVGPVELGILPEGQWRPLTRDEVAAIFEHGRKPAGEPSNVTAKGGGPASRAGSGAPGRPGAPAGRPRPGSGAPRSAGYGGGQRDGGGPSGNGGARAQQQYRGPGAPPRGGTGGSNGGGPVQRNNQRTHETGNRSNPRPGPGQDHGKPAPQRLQVHQDRLHGRVPPRGQRDAADRRGGEGRGQGPRDHRRGQQDS